MDAAFAKSLLDLSFYVAVATLLLPLLAIAWNFIVRWIPGVRRLQIRFSLKGYFICLIAGLGIALWGVHYVLLPFGGEERLQEKF